ncbi:transposase, partial [Roseovarius tolerans]|uniref:transposase n=5 Tax=Roseovarius tolerans TaxID=74031 RepID=UPI0011138FC3
MPARWKNDRPMSRQAFDALFFDEEACSEYLAERRWPDGFVCPSCGTCKGWPLKRNRATWECAGCGRQTSVTAGTVMHSSHLPLRTWFLA